MKTSAISWRTFSSRSGARRRESSSRSHWKFSSSSAASTLSAMARFFGEWNWSQSRSATNSRSSCCRLASGPGPGGFMVSLSDAFPLYGNTPRPAAASVDVGLVLLQGAGAVVRARLLARRALLRPAAILAGVGALRLAPLGALPLLRLLVVLHASLLVIS